MSSAIRQIVTMIATWSEAKAATVCRVSAPRGSATTANRSVHSDSCRSLT